MGQSLEVGFHSEDRNVVDIEVTHVINLPGLAIYKLQVSKLEVGEA